MSVVLSLWLQFFLSFFSQFNASLENIFLQNQAQQLTSLLSTSAPVMISLTEPLNFSDCFSAEQAKVVVETIFNQVTTREFLVDQSQPLIWNNHGAIISARWSFVSRNSSKKYLLRLYFFISFEKSGGKEGLRAVIREIRAERL
ncbi:MAG: hypothetical protein H5U07_04585 [Candidatus Aminicenantes bacterium]|nr:hypothetical protein [Candidatus Aminicenantes bacterium]